MKNLQIASRTGANNHLRFKSENLFLEARSNPDHGGNLQYLCDSYCYNTGLTEDSNNGTTDFIVDQIK